MAEQPVTDARVPVTVVVLTLNEEARIERVLRSVDWADERLVVDSGSCDATIELAKRAGAKVVRQAWLGYAAQREKGFDLARNDWVMYLDADEIVSTRLGESVRRVMRSQPDPRDAFAMRRRGDFLGILLDNPQRRKRLLEFVRLFNRRESGFDTSVLVHEVVRVVGKTHLLDGDLIHWRGYTVDEYAVAFNRYASLEAEELDRLGKQASPSAIALRPVVRFVWLYVRKGAWRHGTRGLIYAGLKAMNEFLRYAKHWERHNAPPCPHPPPGMYDDDGNWGRP